MKKINGFASAAEVMFYLQKYDLTFKLFSDYERGGAYIDPCCEYFFEHDSWYCYITEKGKRTSEIFNIDSDVMLYLIYNNQIQINDRYHDRTRWIFPQNYINHETGKPKRIEV